MRSSTSRTELLDGAGSVWSVHRFPVTTRVTLSNCEETEVPRNRYELKLILASEDGAITDDDEVTHTRVTLSTRVNVQYLTFISLFTKYLS